GEGDRGLRHRRRDEHGDQQKRHDDSDHDRSYSRVRRAPSDCAASSSPCWAPLVVSVAANGEAPRVPSQPRSGLLAASGEMRSNVGGPATKRWPPPPRSSLTMRWPGRPSTRRYQPATRSTSSTATVTLPMPVTPLACCVCRGTRSVRGVSSW